MDFEDLVDEGDDQQNGGTFNGTGTDDIFLFSGMNQEETALLKDQKDAVIFLIDCRQSMFEPNPHNPNSSNSIDQILKATLSFMKTKIISSDSDKVGVILFGCETSDNPLNFKHISVLQNLDCLDAQIIKDFQHKSETFETNFVPAKVQAPLFDALWICHHEFKTVEKQNFSKRIFLFTDEDNPEMSEADQRMTQ